MITQSRLKATLEYNKDTGLFFWKENRGKFCCKGKTAGCVSYDKYISIKIDGKKYFAHRLAWLWVFGKMPINEIDHINNNRQDNRIENLRLATRAENNQNIKEANKKSLHGFLGVSPRKNSWRARIQCGKKRIHIGDFQTPEEAHLAYLKAKKDLHPFSTIT